MPPPSLCRATAAAGEGGHRLELQVSTAINNCVQSFKPAERRQGTPEQLAGAALATALAHRALAEGQLRCHPTIPTGLSPLPYGLCAEGLTATPGATRLCGWSEAGGGRRGGSRYRAAWAAERRWAGGHIQSCTVSELAHTCVGQLQRHGGAHFSCRGRRAAAQQPKGSSRPAGTAAAGSAGQGST